MQMALHAMIEWIPQNVLILCTFSLPACGELEKYDIFSVHL